MKGNYSTNDEVALNLAQGTFYTQRDIPKINIKSPPATFPSKRISITLIHESIKPARDPIDIVN